VKETLKIDKQNFTNPTEITNNWTKKISVFNDQIRFYVSMDTLKEPAEVITYNIAIDLSHTWYASVEEGKHSLPIITNSVWSWYGTVIRNPKTNELMGFVLNTFYFIDFNTLI
jgi:hypothetical protein